MAVGCSADTSKSGSDYVKPPRVGSADLGVEACSLPVSIDEPSLRSVDVFVGLEIGTYIDGAFPQNGNEGYEVDFVEGDEVSLHLFAVDGDADPYLFLYGPLSGTAWNNEPLVCHNDDSEASAGLDAEIQVAIEETGTYLLVVHDLKGTHGASYSVGVEEFTAGADDGPCAGKSCGDSCSLCAGRPGCVETAVLKSCHADGQCRAGVPTMCGARAGRRSRSLRGQVLWRRVQLVCGAARAAWKRRC